MSRLRPVILPAVVLVTAALTAGALSIAPATAHFGPFGHLKKHFLSQTIVVTDSDSVGEFVSESKTVLCPGGYQALGGGMSAETPPAGAGGAIAIELHGSGPTVGGAKPGATPSGTSAFADGWYVEVGGVGPGTQGYRVSVVCAKPAS